MTLDRRIDGDVALESDVLVVGAGLAGATAARSLVAAGLRVRVLDKGRGPGGRLSTRRAASGSFDHGASSLQAVGEDFRAWLGDMAEAGAATVGADDQWAGVPGMNALVAHTLDGLSPQWSCTVASLAQAEGRWAALDAAGAILATAPQLVLAVPAPQARALLASLEVDAPAERAGSGAMAALVAALAAARYAPCWAAMVVTAPEPDRPVAVAPARVDGDVIERIAREDDKPARASGHWVVHAATAWSIHHLERPADEVALLLGEAFVAATGIDRSQLLSVSAHRWRYASPLVGVDHAGYPDLGLHLAGDAVGWRAEAGVPPAENAWRSGRAAARSILGRAVDQPKS
jgi:hypothetical protein